MALRLTFPLSLRVPLIVAGLMVMMGVIASQLVLSSLVRSQERQLSDLAQSEFATLSTALAPLIQRQDLWEMFDALERATQRVGGFAPLSATLVDALGNVIVSSQPEDYPIGASGIELINAASLVSAINFDNAQDRISLRKSVEFQDRAIAQLVIDFDVAELAAERRQTWFWLLAGNATATLVLALAGYLLIRRVLAPIGRLSREMSQPGGASQAFPEALIPRYDTELANLYQTYNGMIRAVEARGLTERRLAERERFVSLGRLAGTLAHEINNPLGGLLNETDTLQRFSDRPDVVRRSADILDRGLKQMREVVRTTLNMHRNDQAALPLTSADFEDLHQLISPEVERKSQDLHWQVAVSDTCFGGLPAGPVRQVLLNLLLNAADATQPGASLGLEVQAHDGALHLTIWDSGPGLPDHLRPRLLSDDPVEPGGGLGLRLVRELVQNLGGTIDLVLTTGGHNAVQISLPIKKDADA